MGSKAAFGAVPEDGPCIDRYTQALHICRLVFSPIRLLPWSTSQRPQNPTSQTLPPQWPEEQQQNGQCTGRRTVVARRNMTKCKRKQPKAAPCSGQLLQNIAKAARSDLGRFFLFGSMLRLWHWSGAYGNIWLQILNQV